MAPEEVFGTTLHPHLGLASAQDIVKRLEEHTWIDFHTVWVGIRMLLLNPDLGVFCSVTVNLYFGRSGSLIPYVKTTTFLVDPYQFAWVFTCDILFSLLWLHLVVTNAMRLHDACRGPPDHLIAHVLNGSNVIEWGSACGGLVMIILWVVYLFKLGDLIHIVNSVLDARPEMGVASSQTYSNAVLELQAFTNELDSFVSALRIYTGWYTIGLVLRFFKAFQAQPRLGVITRSIIRCIPGLLSFAVVFVVMVMSFTASGMFLFGHRLLEFSTFGLGLQSSMKIMLGDFDFDELADEYPELASIWFFSFIALLSLLMFNMCLAIVMDTFSAVKGSAMSLDSLWDQISEFIDDIKNRNVRVSEHHLARVVRDLNLEQVGKSDLCAACPGLSAEQASLIIDRVNEIESKVDDLDLTLSDAARVMLSVKGRVLQMSQQINDVSAKHAKICNAVAALSRAAWLAGKSTWLPGMIPTQVALATRSRTRFRALHAELERLERTCKEAMSFVAYRGKEMRETLIGLQSGLADHTFFSPGATRDVKYDALPKNRPATGSIRC